MRYSFLLSGLAPLMWLLAACSPSSTNLPSATRQDIIINTPSPIQTTGLQLKTLTPVLPPPTRSNDSVEITFRWDVGTNITDVDDVTELSVRLRDRPGIMGAYGDEIQITVVYDPQKTTPENIARVLSDMGFPVKKP